MHVSGLKPARIFNVQLFLTAFGLALGAFDRHARRIERVAHRPHRRFGARIAHQRIVDIVARDRGRIGVARVEELRIAFLEQEEFQLGRHHHVKAHVLGALELRFQHLARRMGDRLVAVMIEQIADHQRRARNPRDQPQRLHVGLHHVIAVAALPARRVIARHGDHFHVGRQQVVAAMGLFPSAVDEMRRVEPLALKPSLHIHKGCDDRIDLACIDRFLERVER